VGAFRAKLCAIGLLVALAACGRVGYEQVQIAEIGDGPLAPRDAGVPIDQQAPADTGSTSPIDLHPDEGGPIDVRPPDVPDASTSPEASPPDVQDTSPPPPDVMTPPPDVMAPPPDAAVDAATARTVVASGQNATPRRGGSGVGVVDICPGGQLLVGFEGTESPNGASPIQSMVAVCAAVTFPIGGGSPTPWPLTRLPARGNTSGQRWVRICPAGHVLAGFDGNARNVIGDLVLRCKRVSLGPGGTSLVLGSESELDDLGGPTLDDFTQSDCSNDQAVRGAETRFGSVLEAFGLICSTALVVQ
jgi:hypothetical protein